MMFLSKLARRLARLRAASLAAWLFACGTDALTEPDGSGSSPSSLSKIDSVVVAPPADSGAIGETIRFVATLVDSAGHSVTGSDAVVWRAADTSIARVDSSGLVTYLRVGRTSITASAGGQRDVVPVTVLPSPVHAVSVTPASSRIGVGELLNLSASVRDPAGHVLQGRRVQWSSSAPSVARVDSTGHVTGAGAGTVNISANSEGRTGTASVTVLMLPVASVTVTPARANVSAGATAFLTAATLDSAGRPLPGRAITWSSGSPSTATVDSTGLVTARAAGTVTIQAASEGRTGTSVLTITTIPVASVSVSPSAANVFTGGTVAFVATARDAAGQTLPERAYAWVSVDTTVASVSPLGVVSGHAAGSTQVIVTSEGRSDTAAVTVLPMPVASVVVTPSVGSVIIGSTMQLSATPRDSTGQSLTGRSTSWSSSNAAVATVSAGGVVTGVSAGTATVTATAEGKSGSAAITVRLIPVASVTVSPATVSLAPRATQQLTATPLDSAGNVLSGRPITWVSDNTTVATVTATGLVTAASGGTTTIAATVEGWTGVASIVVNASAGYYVAPAGSSGGDGSINSPWNLATALSGASGRVRPGDTLWVRGGTYTGSFQSTFSGTSGRPIVVRRYRDERAIIDGAGTAPTTTTLAVRGDYTVLWGLEITNSSTTRTTTVAGNGGRSPSVVNYGNHTKYLNLIIHDGGVAFYQEAGYSDVEIAGCIIYNNGWEGPDRGHGHALYLKSNTGPLLVRDNVLFNQYGYGVHVYTNAGEGQLNNMRFEGNVAFNNGTLSAISPSSNILLGGDAYATGDVLRDNLTYFSPGITGTNVRVGYGTLANGDVTLEGNTFAGGAPVLEMGFWDRATLSGNTLVGSSALVSLNDNSLSGYSWSGTRQYGDPLLPSWRFGGTPLLWAAWQTATGLGSSDVVTGGNPGGTNVTVRANPIEAGRAMIVVYNWSGQGTTSANLSGVLSAGDPYEVRNAQALFGAPVASGTYGGGSISIPLTGVTPPVPVGLSSSRAPRTGPSFDVFIVTRS